MQVLTVNVPAEELVGRTRNLLIKVNVSPRRHGRTAGEETLFGLMRDEIERQSCMGNVRTAETYSTALRSFSRFRGGRDVPIARFNADLVKSYEAWLKHKGLSLNTISFYMRRLRAVYRRGLGRGLYADSNPFRDAFTGVNKTRKRALTIKTIRKIKDYSPHDAREELARDLFLFSFLTRGMSFIDIALLKKSDLAGGSIVYKRKKTGQSMEVGISREIADIIRRHPGHGAYLLPIIKKTNGKERNQLRYVQTWVNVELKKIGRRIAPGTKLTMYVARHSWATAARDLGVPVSVISNAMGHTSERTTQIYLQSICTEVINKANSVVTKALMGGESN